MMGWVAVIYDTGRRDASTRSDASCGVWVVVQSVVACCASTETLMTVCVLL